MIPAGWNQCPWDMTKLRYWDGARWTGHTKDRPPPPHQRRPGPPPPGATNVGSRPPISREQIAHDLAIVYLNNRYGIEVTGEFSVTSDNDYGRDIVTDVSGWGSVETQRMPDLNTPETMAVGTGTRRMFGLGSERMQAVATGRFEVDDTLRGMIHDYHMTYARILGLLGGST